MRSILKRQFFRAIIAPKYVSSLGKMKNFKVFFSCYEYITDMLSVKIRSNHLFSYTKGDSFIDNYLYFIDLPFFSSQKKMKNLNILIDKLTL